MRERVEAAIEFSLNHATFPQLSVEELLRLAEAHGIAHVALWRDDIARGGLNRVRAMLRAGGFGLSSLCRGGWFTARDRYEWRTRIDDNLRAIDDAAALGADVLPLVCGPAPDANLPRARRAVVDAIAEIAPRAASAGVRLGIEPLHPVFTGDRSVVVTLGQARAIRDEVDSDHVGVVVDAFNTWWDPGLDAEVAALADRVVGVQVADWLMASDDRAVADRGTPGDGIIDLTAFFGLLRTIPFTGPVEIEIISSRLARLGHEDADRELARALAFLSTTADAGVPAS